MRIKLLVLLFIFITVTVYAQADTKYQPYDFAYGFNIELGSACETSGYYALTLPQHVYEGVYNADLSDTMLFNSKGEIVPFALMRPLPSDIRTIDDSLFPFFTATETIDNKSYVSEIIVDMSSLSNNMTKLRFEFSGELGFNADATVYYSTDSLNEWTKLAEGSIAYLKSDTTELIRDTIELDRELSKSVKYLSIRTNPLVAVGQIDAVYMSSEPELVYKKADYVKAEGIVSLDSPDRAVFALDGYFPVEWISFDIRDSYLFPEFSLATEYEGSFYHLRTVRELMEYPLDPAVLGAAMEDVRAKKWELTTMADLPSDGLYADFYWRGDELIFMCNGGNSYTFVYGNASFVPAESSSYISDSVSRYQSEAQRLEGDFNRIDFAGEKALEKVIPDNPQKLKYIMIAVLAVIVLVMTVLTIRLIIDINKKQA